MLSTCHLSIKTGCLAKTLASSTWGLAQRPQGLCRRGLLQPICPAAGSSPNPCGADHPLSAYIPHHCPSQEVAQPLDLRPGPAWSCPCLKIIECGRQHSALATPREEESGGQGPGEHRSHCSQRHARHMHKESNQQLGWAVGDSSGRYHWGPGAQLCTVRVPISAGNRWAWPGLHLTRCVSGCRAPAVQSRRHPRAVPRLQPGGPQRVERSRPGA